jgi:hypothetical protein
MQISNMTIKQYNGQDANFYIQCKGEHSGRPLRKAIPNCFAIFTDISNAYEIAYAAFISKSYYRHIKGTCVPYIRIADAKEVLSLFISKTTEQKTANLKKIEQIDLAINKAEEQLKLLKQMKVAIAYNYAK